MSIPVLLNLCGVLAFALLGYAMFLAVRGPKDKTPLFVDGSETKDKPSKGH